jgi:hypothetical protein
MTAEEFIKQAHDYSKGKVCSKCNEHKPFSEFHKGIHYKDGLTYKCKFCAKEYRDNECPFKKWFLHKKGRAKQNGIEFTILPTDIPGVEIEWYNIGKQGSKDTWRGIKYPKVCTVLGIELDWGMNGNQPNSPSLDRNPNFGYVKGKVEMMSHLANIMKNNATPEQLKQFSEYHLSHPQLDTNPNQIGLF